jgi:hypothetical protein
VPNYTKLQATALRLVTSAGRSMKFHKVTKTLTDSSKPWGESTAGSSQVTMPAVQVEPSSAQRLGCRALADDMLKRLDKILIVAPGASTADLVEYHEVEDEGRRWAIDFVDKLRPGDKTLLYFVGVRR